MQPTILTTMGVGHDNQCFLRNTALVQFLKKTDLYHLNQICQICYKLVDLKEHNQTVHVYVLLNFLWYGRKQLHDLLAQLEKALTINSMYFSVYRDCSGKKKK